MVLIKHRGGKKDKKVATKRRPEGSKSHILSHRGIIWASKDVKKTEKGRSRKEYSFKREARYLSRGYK